MLKVIDTFQVINRLRDKVLSNPEFLYEYWLDYIDEYSSIRELCISDSQQTDFNRVIGPILVKALGEEYDKLALAHDNFVNSISLVQDKFNDIFSLNQDINIYFYIGLCNGAGWAIEIEGIQSVLIGVEKVVELNWHNKDSMISLIHHELCHVAHSVIRKESLDAHFDNQAKNNIWELYIEGFAQRMQQKLYLENYYHQDDGQWLAWCKSHHKLICAEYLHRIEKGLSVTEFYGDWNRFNGYSDVGYYLGCEFIKYIEDKYTVIELAKLDIQSLGRLLVRFLKSEQKLEK